MSHLSYKSYEGYGTNVQDIYSQSVRVGDHVYISGQGGWVTSDVETIPETQEEQIDQAFINIDVALREAGASFGNVFKVHSYHLPIGEAALDRVKVNFDKWLPNHRPLWTAVGVAGLGWPKMSVEIEVVAHLPKA